MRRLLTAAVAACALSWVGPAAAMTYYLDFEDMDLGTVFGDFVVAESPTGGKALLGNIDFFKVNPIGPRFFEQLPEPFAALPAPGAKEAYTVTAFDLRFPAELFGVRHDPRVIGSNVTHPEPDTWITEAPGRTNFIRATGDFYLDNIRVELVSIAHYVPEPATWALMIGGFGLTGAVLRRRGVDGQVRA